MKIELKDYIIQDTNVCECGHEFILNDIAELSRIDEHGFYANIIKNCSLTKCPKCNKEKLLLLKQKGQTWEILSIATKKNTKTENTIKEAESQNEKETEESKDFICPTCQKVCKNQLGLNAHMRIHEN